MLMMTSVWRALRDSGWRKLPTPLEMASRPVSDEPPLANERSSVMNARPIRIPLPDTPTWPCTRRWAGGSGWAWRSPSAAFT